MIIACTIRERGFCGQALIKEHRNASKQAWVAAGTMWHTTFRDLRFTPQHGKKAGYQPRKGEASGLSEQAFWNSYTGQKLKRWHHKNPLQWSGEVRNNVRTASITSTNTRYSGFGSGASSQGGGVQIAYPGASKLNFRRWPTSPNMAEEFRTLLPDEVTAAAQTYDTALNAIINQSTTTVVRKVA